MFIHSLVDGCLDAFHHLTCYKSAATFRERRQCGNTDLKDAELLVGKVKRPQDKKQLRNAPLGARKGILPSEPQEETNPPNTSPLSQKH